MTQMRKRFLPFPLPDPMTPKSQVPFHSVVGCQCHWATGCDQMGLKR